MSLIANSVYPDEMPHFVAFHQSFHSAYNGLRLHWRLLSYDFKGDRIHSKPGYSLFLYSSHSINLWIYGLHFLVAKLQILNSSLQEGQVWIFSIIIDYYQTQSISRIERNFPLIIDYNRSSIQHYWPSSRNQSWPLYYRLAASAILYPWQIDGPTQRISDNNLCPLNIWSLHHLILNNNLTMLTISLQQRFLGEN